MLARLLRRLRFERLVGWLLVLGISFRVAGFFTGRILSDGAAYGVMAQSLLTDGEFVMPLGEGWSRTWIPEFSHHYPPAYPAFLLPFVAIGGLTPESLKLAALAAGFLLLGVVFWATRDLYGRERALLITAAVSLDPILLQTGTAGYSENFLTLFFALTIWAILKSLREERYIVLAGLAAGVAYLTKSSVGWFFLVAGLAGFAWRFHFAGWAVFRNRPYPLAIGVFLTFVAFWSARNLALFWDGSLASLLTAWQGSAYFGSATGRAIADPAGLALILLVRVPFYALLFLFVGAYWLRDLRRTPKLSDEHYSGLWLAVGLTYLLAWIIAGVYWTLERSPWFWLDQGRYVVLANVIVLWLVVKDLDVRIPRFRKRYAAMVATWIMTSVVVLAQAKPGVFAAYDVLREHAVEGDVVAVDGLPRYEVLVNVGANLTYVPFEEGVAADYILTANVTRSFDGYSLLGIGRTGSGIPGLVPDFDAAVWKHGRPISKDSG